MASLSQQKSLQNARVRRLNLSVYYLLRFWVKVKEKKLIEPRVQIMYILTALNYAAEVGDYSYVATSLSRVITIPALKACIIHSSEHAAAVNIAMPMNFAT